MEQRELEKIKMGIADYKHEQNVILRILRRHGELTGKEFDHIFSCKNMKKKMYFWATSGNAFIMGSFYQGQWSKWLHLTQLMCEIGFIKIFKKNGLVIYKATQRILV